MNDNRNTDGATCYIPAVRPQQPTQAMQRLIGDLEQYRADHPQLVDALQRRAAQNYYDQDIGCTQPLMALLTDVIPLPGMTQRVLAGHYSS